jgi:hypothetical protein
VVRGLIEAAGAAPSIHDTQPWRFRVTDELIEVHGHPDRMLWVADPRGRALHLSCGAALFNLRLAIRMLGAKPLVWPLPDPEGKPTLLASVELAPGRPPTSDERTMFETIYQRHTSRAPFSERPIPESVRLPLEQEAACEFAVFRMLNSSDASAVLDLAATAEQELAADFSHRVELGRWIGTEGNDGIPSDEQVELHDVARRGGKWWPWREWPQIIIRLGYGPTGKRSPRRGVDRDRGHDLRRLGRVTPGGHDQVRRDHQLRTAPLARDNRAAPGSPSSGTFRSARTKTRRPDTSRSSMVFIGKRFSWRSAAQSCSCARSCPRRSEHVLARGASFQGHWYVTYVLTTGTTPAWTRG